MGSRYRTAQRTKPNLTKPVSSVTPPPCPSYSGRKGSWAFQSKPDVAQRHGPDLNPNRGGGRLTAPLLNNTDHVCRGFAALRHAVLLWMPE